MSNIFNKNPIHLNLVSIVKNATIQTIIFIGTVPPNIEKAIIKLNNKTINNKEQIELKKYYGSNWKKKLRPTTYKTGGDDIDIDIDIDIDEIFNKDIKDKDIKDKDIKSFNLKSHIQKNPINTLLYTPQKILYVFKDSLVEFFQEDNILDFKTYRILMTTSFIVIITFIICFS